MPAYSVKTLLSLVPEGTFVSQKMGDYSLTEKDMRVALALCREFRPHNVLEFGVCQGHTAKFLLDNCPGIMYYVGIDLLPDKFPKRGIVPKQAGALVSGRPAYNRILTDETVGDFTCKLGRWLRSTYQEEFDCIIMDANHEDWATKRDTDACAPYMKPGGLWLWHDYNVESRQHPNGKVFGVKRYLDGLIAEGRRIMTPDEEDRDPWKCCSLAWEIAQ